jgi:hypothetical protein
MTMPSIIQNVDLAPTVSGFETCAATAGGVAVYTGNWFAAYSTDGGNNFHAISPQDMMKLAGRTFCCDQRVEYVPNIDSIAWILLSQPENSAIMLAVARPGEIAGSNGRNWTYYVITPSTFRLQSDSFDYPQISFGNKYLYLTANKMGSGGAIVARFPLDQIGNRATMFGQFITTDQQYVCPCHNTLDVGWFGTFKSDSEVRVFTWEEDPAALVFPFDVNIATVPTTDFSSFTKEGDDWLPPTSKVQSIITGAARSRQHLFLAWSAGRKYASGEASPFTQPHIEWVQIDVPTKTLVTQRYIWNPAFGFAWPSLAANGDQDTKIALSCCFGGGDLYPQHAVGVIGDPPLLATTSGRSAGAGGHYNDVRMCFPNTNQFVAAGFVAAKNGDPPVVADHPHYIIFQPGA